MGSRSRICDSTSVSKACSRKRSCMHSVHPVAISVSTVCPQTAVSDQVGFAWANRSARRSKGITEWSMQLRWARSTARPSSSLEARAGQSACGTPSGQTYRQAAQRAYQSVHAVALGVTDMVCEAIEQRIGETLLHGGFARRVLTARRLRSCYSSEYRTPELVHPVEGLDGNCNFSRTTGIVA